MAATMSFSSSAPSLHGSQASRDEFGDSEWQNWARDSFSSTSSARFFDADSDGGSFRTASEASTQEAGSPESSLGRRIYLDKQLLQWKERFEEEHSKRLEAEDKLVQAQARQDELQLRLSSATEDLSRERAQCVKLEQRKETVGQASLPREDDKSEAIVARLVGGMMSKVVAEDAAERKWSAEVQLLRQRLERSAIMQNMVQKLKDEETLKQEEMWRRYLQVSTVTALCGIAIVGAAVLSKRFRGVQV